MNLLVHPVFPVTPFWWSMSSVVPTAHTRRLLTNASFTTSAVDCGKKYAAVHLMLAQISTSTGRKVPSPTWCVNSGSSGFPNALTAEKSIPPLEQPRHLLLRENGLVTLASSSVGSRLMYFGVALISVSLNGFYVNKRQQTTSEVVLSITQHHCRPRQSTIYFVHLACRIHFFPRPPQHFHQQEHQIRAPVFFVPHAAGKLCVVHHHHMPSSK